MRRTLYIDNVVIDEQMLNNTENSKIQEILLHHNSLGISGVISGLDINISPANNFAISVSSGSAVLSNREVVNLDNSIEELQLASNDSGVYNLVVAFYEESFSKKKPNQIGSEDFYSFAESSCRIQVLTLEQYLALQQSNVDPNIQTLENSLIIGIVIGNGLSSPLLSTSIIKPSEDQILTDFGNFKLIDGIVIKSTNIKSTSNKGVLKYDLTNKRIRFISPNNPNPPAKDDLGENFLQILENGEEVTEDNSNVISATTFNYILEDPDFQEDTITLDIFLPIYPISINSIESSRLPSLISSGLIVPIFRNPTLDVNLLSLTESQIQDFIANDSISNFIVNEEIEFNDLYTQNKTELISGVEVELAKYSAVDTLHRELTGDGQTNTNNPHGLSIDNIAKIFDSIKGSLNVGNLLNKSGFDALIPRIISAAHDRSRYTLFFETNYLGSSPSYPIRVYINSPGVDSDTFSGITLTINARWIESDNLWYKDSTGVNSVRLQLNYNEFIYTFNDSPVSSITDNDWGRIDWQTDAFHTSILNSLGIVPKTNTEHNTSSNFSALLNVEENPQSTEEEPLRPNKMLIFESTGSTLGDLRIYFGKDQNLRELTEEVDTGEVDEFDQPIFETIRFAPETLDFTINAKPQLESLNWSKESGLTSYMLRYRFSDSIFSAYRFNNSTATSFLDGEWEEVSFSINGGIRATQNSVITGNFIINNDGITFNQEQTRRKIIPVREIGFNKAFGGSAGYFTPVLDTGGNSDAYFEWARGNSEGYGTLDYGTPQRVVYGAEILGGNLLDVPRYINTGPRRPIIRGRAEDTAGGGNGDQMIVAFTSYNGTSRYLIPLKFEEEEVNLIDFKLPIDIFGEDYNSAGIPQTLEFGGTFSPTVWFAGNFWDTDVISGNSNLISPPNDGSVIFTYESIGNGGYMIHIRSATPGASFLNINKSSSPYKDRSVVYFHLTSNVNSRRGWTQINSDPNNSSPAITRQEWPATIEGAEYDYWHIGGPIIQYTTRNIE